VNQRFPEGVYSTADADGAFDFGPLTAGTYSFGVNIGDNATRSRYSLRAIYPEKIVIGASQTVDDLKFVLPPDRPAPSVSITVTVLDREGKPLPNATVFADDALWPDFHGDLQRTGKTGKTTVVLRKGSFYNIWSYAEAPEFKQQCAEPVGIAVDQPAQIQLKISRNIGNCGQFSKARP
jgi:uncharacterized GH25 family protein